VSLPETVPLTINEPEPHPTSRLSVLLCRERMLVADGVYAGPMEYVVRVGGQLGIYGPDGRLRRSYA
jgi:hypothetical protein